MSNDKFYTKDQIDAFLADINEKMVMPTIGVGGGFAAVGMLGWYDGYVPPQGWLSCDGTVYDIADYPDLAAHYASQYGSANVFGGDGITTFAVRDLQGEYLRCCGTNSHTGQGDGAAVGVHQDATEIMHSQTYSSALHMYKSGGTNQDGENADKLKGSSTSCSAITGNSITDEWAKNAYTNFTTRPTTTCFPVCVKASKSDGAWHDYSTEEKEVGTWIDGSKLYERTFVGTRTFTPNAWNANILGTTGIDIKKCEALYVASGTKYHVGGYRDSTNYSALSFGADVNFYMSTAPASATGYEITIQYTKTS